MNLLIVDDEVRQVKALRTIIQRLKPHYTISEAFDGKTAWHMIQNKPIDAMITDIRMPVMDGMELIDRLRSYRSPIKIALLSGYSEFDYARSALRHGVVDYIVKPISHQNIRDVLHRFEEMLHHDREVKKKQEIYEAGLWQRLVSGSITPEELADLRRRIRPDDPGILCAGEIGTRPSSAPDSGILRKIGDGLSHSLPFVRETICLPDGRRPGRFIAILRLHRATTWPKAEIRHSLAKRIDERLLTQFPSLKLGIGPVAASLLSDAAACYQQATLALDYHFYKEDVPVLFHDEVRAFQPGIAGCPLNLEQTVQALLAGDRIAVSRELDRLFGERGSHHPSYPAPEVCRQQAVQFLLMAAEQIKPFLTSPAGEAMLVRHIAAVQNASTRSELRLRLIQWADAAISRIGSLQQDKNGLIIRRCCEYIGQHYREELSLEHIARKYHFNPSYFSSLFRTKTGMTFSDYVLETRLENAKRLLKETNAKVAEISQKVGFNHPAYFIKMFKRKTGLSPNQFRKWAGSGSR